MLTYKGLKFCVQSSGRYYQANRRDLPERLLHRIVWAEANGSIPPGFHVHHIDGDWRNNELDNLELIEGREHSRQHMTARNAADPEAQAVNLAAAREAAKAWHASPEGLAWHRENGKRSWAARRTWSQACEECGQMFTTAWPAKRCSRRCHNAYQYRKRKAE